MFGTLTQVFFVAFTFSGNVGNEDCVKTGGVTTGDAADGSAA